MSLSLVDEEQIGTAVAQKAIDRLLAASARVAAKWTAKYKNKTLRSFSNYLAHRYRRARQIRNLIYDNDSGELDKLYVGTELRNVTPRATRHISDSELVAALSVEETPAKDNHESGRPTIAAIVRGGAGTGKSMLMRWLFLRLCEGKSRVPIFVELRDYNEPLPQDAFSLIQQEFASHDSEISRAQVELGLKAGLFTLLLDGLDEVDPEWEAHWHKRITSLAKKYPLCPFIVSGRPSSEMLAWSDFRIWDVESLTEEKVEALVNKLDVDSLVKVKFVDECRARLFESHFEFLQIPLLVTVMLITYSDNGRISNETHEFYEDAFSALWNRHDARKEGFQRRRYCGLARHKFLDLLSAFSASSYVRSVFSFRDVDFEKHFENAKRLTGIETDLDSFRKDLIRSTSLCMVEGAFLRFSHRSFQEYFCALYILRLDDGRAAEALEEVSARFQTDNVLHVVHSTDQERFERCFAIPAITNFLERVAQEARKREQHSIRAVRDFYNMRPTNEEIAAALDARKEMALMGEEPYLPELEKLLRRDAKNLRGLRTKLLSKLSERETARNQVFGQIDG